MFYDTLGPCEALACTPDGYLHINANVARSGIQVYSGQEVGRPELERVAVYRDAAEVFAADSLQTFAALPLTLDHPSEPVSACNWHDLAVGTTGEEVLREGEYLKIGLRVSDAKALAAIAAGKRALSVGYAADLIWGDGVDDQGQVYQARQTRIRANHIALVDAARAGPGARIPLDDGGAIAPRTSLVIDGHSLSLPKADAAIVEAALARVEGERDALDQQLKAHTQAQNQAQSFDAIEALVAERTALIAQAQAIAPEVETRGLSADEIRRQVVMAKGVDVSDRVAAYIDARFDALAEVQAGLRLQADPVGAVSTHALHDARRAYITQLTSAWKGTKQ